MQDYVYSVIGLIAIVIQLIINFKVMFKPENDSVRKAANKYRLLMLAIFLYYITDALWGIFAGLNWIPALFLDTTLYYVAMSLVIVFYYRYIVEYLEMKGLKAKLFDYFGQAFFMLENLFLIINFFYPCFFWFDENDAYIAGPIRYVALWIQVAMFGLSSLVTFVEVFKTNDVNKKRHVAIYSVSLAMLVAILFQEKYPLLPFYAVGCLIGCCILYVYVVGDELEEYRKLLVSEKEKLENTKIELEAANHAKSMFLFNMSHDIRTPMNAIIGFTDIAEKYIDNKEKVRDSLEKVKMSSEHLLMLINDVLDMSRVESGIVELEEEPICIDVFNDNLFSMLNGSAEAKNIILKSEVDESVVHHWLNADRLRLMRVLTNVISNSIKYTNPGGKINILIKESACEKEGYAKYCYIISDTGIGMSKDFLSHVFEPFSRAENSTKSGVIGTGLGMAITKSLVEIMSGTISIESKIGVGTTVCVEIENRISEPVERKSVVLQEQPLQVAGKKILLVEDNQLNREIATDILEEAGFIIDFAEDGDVAVEKVSNSENQYDLILMDIQMPRMNGYEATKAIRKLPSEEKAQIPIIAMTANAFDDDKKNSFDVGMNGHIAKPIDVDKLMQTISEIIVG